MQFDGILEGSGQDSVYSTCAHEVADSLLSGYNGTVFCYGQVCFASEMLSQCQKVMAGSWCSAAVGACLLETASHLIKAIQPPLGAQHQISYCCNDICTTVHCISHDSSSTSSNGRTDSSSIRTAITALWQLSGKLLHQCQRLFTFAFSTLCNTCTWCV